VCSSDLLEDGGDSQSRAHARSVPHVSSLPEGRDMRARLAEQRHLESVREINVELVDMDSELVQLTTGKQAGKFSRWQWLGRSAFLFKLMVAVNVVMVGTLFGYFHGALGCARLNDDLSLRVVGGISGVCGFYFAAVWVFPVCSPHQDFVPQPSSLTSGRGREVDPGAGGESSLDNYEASPSLGWVVRRRSRAKMWILKNRVFLQVFSKCRFWAFEAFIIVTQFQRKFGFPRVIIYRTQALSTRIMVTSAI